ncbi:pyridoxamine 5'-phosphate oxidase [Kocuria sediminis]|uniref:Pyridoxamine 5'-phosphate oxidase n=1 Tax=Kocuria sediminis TaxID=1038857 RepID=A0A6N8GFT0_9MICC|nr:pyridoxamine 5'-phosphate oxidase family protein [Kocuria sediminis]MUN62011.1 pyridoxamine 5'-phosphate oxidase [Kocuria sediminis]
MSTHQDDIQHIVEFVNRTRVGMLGTREPTGKLVSRPMTVVDVAPGEDLDFFTSRDTSAVRDVRTNDAVNVAFVGDHEWVSISGAAEVVEDPAVIEGLWSDALRAYYPDGPSTPGLVVLRVRTETAEHWRAPGTVATALRWAKARATGGQIDPGESTVVDL